MQRLQDIAIKVESPEGIQASHGNALPILHEILHALQRFSTEGEQSCIDLRSLPFGPGDEEELLRLLGRGEINMTMDALGESTIWETAFSGVWIVDHRNAEGERVALQIEIGSVPQIVFSQQEDIVDAIDRLAAQLEEH
ncbi:MAG: hydrogenase expression/formation protein [Candidatus Thiodiazotropha taylori]|nr:hydrogenase expression/formation protein [Candidatus Thiodiazotropha taylori]MCG7964156.1 hydrogenase expression/formation protein [Candidatus Thiodiazotropha endolucinida]RLW53200.1 MAG: hydrogenase accessory protein HupE [gamma proteobacterium symbiont of Stewartia floridana]MCG7868026.1 hydrogenase expression/formation protein [Candidatus Thiodiazotropha taylori]MCG7894249.1 hydrogenase expression/formation protein [Candidatus Thiodiazotropha taylori]